MVSITDVLRVILYALKYGYFYVILCESQCTCLFGSTLVIHSTHVSHIHV